MKVNLPLCSLFGEIKKSLFPNHYLMLLCGAGFFPVGVCQRKSLQTSFTKDNPRTQTKNNIGRSPRDAGDAPEGLGEHDSQIEKDNRSQGQTF